MVIRCVYAVFLKENFISTPVIFFLFLFFAANKFDINKNGGSCYVRNSLYELGPASISTKQPVTYLTHDLYDTKYNQCGRSPYCMWHQILCDFIRILHRIAMEAVACGGRPRSEHILIQWVAIDCMTSGWQRLVMSALSANVPLSKPAPHFCQQQSHNGNEIDINYWLVALESLNIHQNWFHRDTNLWLCWSII